MTATTNNVIEYKITKQCKEAFEKVLNLIAKKERKIIETQDLLLAFASTADTGAAYSLGRFSITKKKLEDEIKQAKLMDKRYIEINEDEFEQNDLFISQKKKRKIQEYIKANQVQFIYESSTDQAIKYMSEYPISNNVKDIIDFAEEMRFQNNPSGGIDTYWIIMGMSQDEDCNAYHVLKKLMLKYDNIFDGDKMSERFQNRSYLTNNYYDGRNEEEQRKNATIRNRISNKLADPSYSILEDITTDLTEKARNKELMPAIKREREIHHMEIALSRRDKNNVSLIGKGGVGKSAIVDGLALKIVNNEIPSLKKSSPDSCVKCYTMFLPFLLIKIDVFS
ncbi:hypothetical protein W470_02710 [Staphylococcus aureus VET0159R]|uniref:ATP-dependent Clp protease ATP-binding subunit n=1 Tax=Staphylococcus aureus TaxID=1280 RepID=UPI00045209F3|nr:ATP-dependent Clp protease ATP-binding subunit [Staphylococcus aureus]EZS82562.1 hypothetical protein W470_02710 [Staphylococcus aureus VET0159R]